MSLAASMIASLDILLWSYNLIIQPQVLVSDLLTDNEIDVTFLYDFEKIRVCSQCHITWNVIKVEGANISQWSSHPLLKGRGFGHSLS